MPQNYPNRLSTSTSWGASWCVGNLWDHHPNPPTMLVHIQIYSHPWVTGNIISKYLCLNNDEFANPGKNALPDTIWWFNISIENGHRNSSIYLLKMVILSSSLCGNMTREQPTFFRRIGGDRDDRVTPPIFPDLWSPFPWYLHHAARWCQGRCHDLPEYHPIKNP